MSDVFLRRPGSESPVRARAERTWLTVTGLAVSFFLFGAGVRLRTLPPRLQRPALSRVPPKAVSAPRPLPKERSTAKPEKPIPRRNVVDPSIRKAFLAGDLDRAERLLGRVAGVPRGLASEIRYARCRRAFLREEWGAAIRACEEAEKESPHPRARRLLVWLSARARKLFLEGYAMERADPEAAVRKYREALACAPSESPYRAKAAAKLMGRGRSETLTGTP